LSSVCVGKQEFFRRVKHCEHRDGARKPSGKQSDFIESAWNLVEAFKKD